MLACTWLEYLAIILDRQAHCWDILRYSLCLDWPRNTIFIFNERQLTIGDLRLVFCRQSFQDILEWARGQSGISFRLSLKPSQMKVDSSQISVIYRFPVQPVSVLYKIVMTIIRKLGILSWVFGKSARPGKSQIYLFLPYLVNIIGGSFRLRWAGEDGIATQWHDCYIISVLVLDCLWTCLLS